MILKIFGVDFHIYGLFLGLAILAAFQASLWLAKLRKMETKVLEGLFWWSVGGGIIGARFYHVIDKWKEIYSLDPQSVLYLWNGGLGIYGAIIGGIVGLWLGARQGKIRFDRGLLDIALFGLPLGQAIGRWGNFFNGEIIGKNGEPLFFYESGLDLLLFLGLVFLAKKKVKSGRIAGSYLIGYGLIRLLLEPLRPESIIWKIAGVPTASIVSGLAIVVGLIFFKTKSGGKSRD